MNRKVKTLPFTVSFRISEDDRKTLERIVTKEQTNYSEFVRMRFQNLISNTKRMIV